MMIEVIGLIILTALMSFILGDEFGSWRVRRALNQKRWRYIARRLNRQNLKPQSNGDMCHED